MIILLAGLYGLRRSEVTGLRWKNVDLELGVLKIVEQQPFALNPETTDISNMAPTKSIGRILPITPVTKEWFDRQLIVQQRQRRFCEVSGMTYHDTDLVVALPDGAPIRSDHISSTFSAQLRKWNCRHIRFHDLRHSAATGMHDLTGDIYIVSEVLGHTTEGACISLGLSRKICHVTERYVRVNLSRKQEVLSAYHEAVLAFDNSADKSESV